MILFGQMSSQFQDAPESPGLSHLLFPHQSASRDPTLLQSAIIKRLRFASEEVNRRSMSHTYWLGPLLWEAWKELTTLPDENIPFDPEIFAECILENENKKLEKPLTNLLNNMDRSDPDWASNFVKIFVKSQYKTKEAALNQPAKAGQTLATCQDWVVQFFGPMVRYIRRMQEPYLPDCYYRHGGKTLDELDAWAKKYAGPEFDTRDATAYDQACTSETTNMELCKMDYFSIPDYLQDAYFEFKVSLRTTFGPSAIMRFTGSPDTYDFNTDYCPAYMNLRFKISENLKQNKGMASSGDDIITFFKLVERDSWPVLQKHFTLVLTGEGLERPDFCGWWLFPCGIIRSPILLALKVLYFSEKNDIQHRLDSYFLEAFYTVTHGDLIHDFLRPDELEAHSWFIDYCFKHPSAVIHLTKMALSNNELPSQSEFLDLFHSFEVTKIPYSLFGQSPVGLAS